MTAPTSTNLRGRLLAVRARREALLQERGDLERRPCSREEAGDRIRLYFHAVAQQIPVGLERKAAWFTAPTAPEASPDVLGPLPGDRWIGALILDAVRPLLEARLNAALDMLPWDTGIASADREAEAGRIAHELAAVKREEERITRQLEQRGEDVDRRPDVDPALIVAPDADLGAAAA